MSETTNSASGAKCQYCNGYHPALCPTVKAIEYFENGKIKRVEFKTAADYLAPLTTPFFDHNLKPMC